MKTLFNDFKHFLTDKKSVLSFMKKSCPVTYELITTFKKSLDLIEEVYYLTDNFNKEVSEDFITIAKETYQGVLEFLPEVFLSFEEWMHFDKETLKLIDKPFFLYLMVVDKLSMIENDKQTLDEVHTMFIPRVINELEKEKMVEYLTNKIIKHEANINPEKDLSLTNLTPTMEVECSIIKRHLLGQKHEN